MGKYLYGMFEVWLMVCSWCVYILLCVCVLGRVGKLRGLCLFGFSRLVAVERVLLIEWRYSRVLVYLV